jgi:ABC-type nitrate/sulfonate/bicarbonate transport system substrate-binding protein
MSLNDVTLVPAPPDAMPRLLHRGEVEGAALSVPYSEHATRLGSSQVVFDSRQIPGEITVVLAADPELLRKQPAAVAGAPAAHRGQAPDADGAGGPPAAGPRVAAGICAGAGR